MKIHTPNRQVKLPESKNNFLIRIAAFRFLLDQFISDGEVWPTVQLWRHKPALSEYFNMHNMCISLGLQEILEKTPSRYSYLFLYNHCCGTIFAVREREDVNVVPLATTNLETTACFPTAIRITGKRAQLVFLFCYCCGYDYSTILCAC